MARKKKTKTPDAAAPAEGAELAAAEEGEEHAEEAEGDDEEGEGVTDGGTQHGSPPSQPLGDKPTEEAPPEPEAPKDPEVDGDADGLKAEDPEAHAELVAQTQADPELVAAEPDAEVELPHRDPRCDAAGRHVSGCGCTGSARDPL